MYCKIDDLPDELLEYIISLLSPYKDLQECMVVSKRWFQATKNVIARKGAHFEKSVAFGTLFWNAHQMHLASTASIGKRHSHSACIYDNSMYVFGGCTATCTTFNDLWRLDLDSRKWNRPITIGSYPSPKACATMLYYNKSFVLFGGWSYPWPYPLYQQWKLFNELHVYCIESNRWNAINSLETPPPTSAHSASIHKNLMIVFGGVTADTGNSNDVWCLNLDNYIWHKQTASPEKPRPRYGQSQVKLDDKHLLVLGGCVKPNEPLNDVWLLIMQGQTWKWKNVKLKNMENSPGIIWCHEACKIGNYIIVLGKNKRQNKQSGMRVSLGKVACPGQSATLNSPATRKKTKEGSQVDRDENVNGRHGSFARSSPAVAPAHSSSSSRTPPPRAPRSYPNATLSMAAFRDEPQSLATNVNRQRQLETLMRMEQRLQRQLATARGLKKLENSLDIFVLDVSEVLTEDCSAAWVKLKQNNQNGPNERILYSLVLGQNELILFGGIKKEQATTQGQIDIDDSEVYNDLHFIKPPMQII